MRFSIYENNELIHPTLKAATVTEAFDIGCMTRRLETCGKLCRRLSLDINQAET